MTALQLIEHCYYNLSFQQFTYEFLMKSLYLHIGTD